VDILYPLYPNSGNLPDVRGKTLLPTDIRNLISLMNLICAPSAHLKVAAKFNCPIVKELDELAVMPAANVQEAGGGKVCDKRPRSRRQTPTTTTPPPQAFAF
jgi:hypothetical protein